MTEPAALAMSPEFPTHDIHGTPLREAQRAEGRRRRALHRRLSCRGAGLTDDTFWWGPTGVMWYDGRDSKPLAGPLPRDPAVGLDGYIYRSFGTSTWFRPDGSPVSPSEHIEIDRHVEKLLRRQMEPT